MQIVIDLQNIIDLCANNIPRLGAHRMLIEQVEAPLFEQLLTYTKGNQSHAARIAGINRKTLTAKMTTYNLTVKKQVGLSCV